MTEVNIPMPKRIAIVYKGKDIGRVIPFQLDQDGNCEFKINFCENEYCGQIYKLFLSEPFYFIADEDSRDWEITYHRHTPTEPTKIRLRPKSGHGKLNIFFEAAIHLEKDQMSYLKLLL